MSSTAAAMSQFAATKARMDPATESNTVMEAVCDEFMQGRHANRRRIDASRCPQGMRIATVITAWEALHTEYLAEAHRRERIITDRALGKVCLDAAIRRCDNAWERVRHAEWFLNSLKYSLEDPKRMDPLRPDREICLCFTEAGPVDGHTSEDDHSAD